MESTSAFIRSQKVCPRLAETKFFRYFTAMNWLTKQEQRVICVVIGLLVTGLLVKFYRAAHPPTEASQSAKP